MLCISDLPEKFLVDQISLVLILMTRLRPITQFETNLKKLDFYWGGPKNWSAIPAKLG